MDWINPTGARKVHSLIDKVYQRKNLEMAWETVKANRGGGGVDGQSLAGFAPQLDQQLQIPKAGKPGEFRTLGIPTIYDRVGQQVLLNRLEPIFEPVLDEANFGYRRGRSTKDAMRKVWKEIQSGREWIVDADLKDFFGSVEHEKLLTLVSQRLADGRVLRLIEAMPKAGSYTKGRLFPTERGTPDQGRRNKAHLLLRNYGFLDFDKLVPSGLSLSLQFGLESLLIAFFRRLPWPAAAFFFTATFRRFGCVDIAYPFPLRPGQVAQNESTLLIGISLNAAQTVTTVWRTEPGTMLVVGFDSTTV